MKKNKVLLFVSIFLVLFVAIAHARWDDEGAWDGIGSSGGGSGAPTDATYITQTVNGSLSAEQALSVLSTGVMRVSTTTGVVSSLTDSAGIAANIDDETGTGVMVFSTSPVLTTPNIGSATGSISGNAATVTTNANLTGEVTSVGNATTITDSIAVSSWNLTTPTITGIAILADAATWLWDFVLASDETQTGITSSQTMGTTVAHGDVVYLAVADSRWEFADASASASSFGLAMALGAGGDGDAVTVLHYGVVRQDTDWNWTIGTPIYLSITGTTTNTLTQTPPSGDGEQVVIIGYPLTADSMVFNPSMVLVEVVV